MNQGVTFEFVVEQLGRLSDEELSTFFSIVCRILANRRAQEVEKEVAANPDLNLDQAVAAYMLGGLMSTLHTDGIHARDLREAVTTLAQNEEFWAVFGNTDQMIAYLARLKSDQPRGKG